MADPFRDETASLHRRVAQLEAENAELRARLAARVPGQPTVVRQQGSGAVVAFVVGVLWTLAGVVFAAWNLPSAGNLGDVMAILFFATLFAFGPGGGLAYLAWRRRSRAPARGVDAPSQRVRVATAADAPRDADDDEEESASDDAAREASAK